MNLDQDFPAANELMDGEFVPEDDLNSEDEEMSQEEEEEEEPQAAPKRGGPKKTQIPWRVAEKSPPLFDA